MCAAAAQAHGRDVGYAELLDLAQAGDPAAARVVNEAAYALGRLAAAVTSLTGVERTILSGEGVRLVEVCPAGFAEGRGQYAAGGPGAIEPVVMPMDFLEWARGAAALAIQHEFP
jgi:predicted NBD/HSP70 family sugar kinase